MHNPDTIQPDLNDIDFPAHPGGQALLDLARQHRRADLLFLSHHLGCNHDLIRRNCERLNVEIAAASDFYSELSQTISNIKKQHQHHITIYEWYCMLVTLLLPVVWYGFAINGSFASGLLFSGLLVSYAFVIFHTRHHRGASVYRNRYLDQATRPIYDLVDSVFMITPAAWREQHQASHQVYPNDPALDYDVYHPSPWIRLHRNQPVQPWHRLQSLYVPVLLLLNGFSFPLTNVSSRGGHIGYAAIYVLLVVIVPIMSHGLSGLILYLSALAPASLIISYMFQVSHNFEELTDTQANSPSDFEAWVEAQVRNSTDYGGYLTTLVFGGINLQASHHVAPALPPTLLYFLSTHLEEKMLNQGKPFYRQRHLGEAVWSYHRRLNQLASGVL